MSQVIVVSCPDASPKTIRRITMKIMASSITDAVNYFLHAGYGSAGQPHVNPAEYLAPPPVEEVQTEVEVFTSQFLNASDVGYAVIWAIIILVAISVLMLGTRVFYRL
jgi:hypothetical protein